MNNQILALCKEIEMPQGISEEAAAADISAVTKFIDTLTSPGLNDEEYKKITDATGDDPRGIKNLALQLSAAVKTREMYKQKNIGDNIFIDTMKCFTRFVLEDVPKYDYYGFDRGWWTYRQLALRIFRLGVLEFETTKREGEKVLSVHIPSDSVMTREALDSSYKQAAEFYKDYDYKYMYCDTWLLAPPLKELLPKESRILNFMADYDIKSTNPDADDFMGWVFVKKYPDLESLPEKTSLQRAVKKHLMAGGKVGSAYGVYKG